MGSACGHHLDLDCIAVEASLQTHQALRLGFQEKITMRHLAQRYRKRVWRSAIAMVLPLFLVVSLPESSSAQSGSVSLTLDPPSAILLQNEVIAVSIIIDALTQPTDAAQVVLNFDPGLLQAVDAAGNPASSVEFGPVINVLWPVKFFNQADNSSGRIVVAAAKGLPGQGGQDANQVFVLAIAHFKALESVDNAAISFDMETDPAPGPSVWRSKIFSQDVEVTGLDTGAAISIPAPVNPTATPAPTDTPVPTPSPTPPAIVFRGGDGGGGDGGGGGGVSQPAPTPTIAFTPTPLATVPVPATVTPTIEVVPETPDKLAVLPDPPETAIPVAAIPEVAIPETAIPVAAIPEVAMPETATPETVVPEAAIREALPATPEPAEVQPADQSSPPQAPTEAPGDGNNRGLLYLGIGLFTGLVLIAVIGGAFLADDRLKGIILRRR